MIGHIITKYRATGIDKSLFEKLLEVFLQLLTMTSGNVSEALSWMTQLDERYGLTNDEYGMGEGKRIYKRR
jgi:Ca-activated chloride channel homolog